MTTLLKSLNGNDVEAGFWSGNTEAIQLGALPVITLQQFAEYASTALAEEVIPTLSDEEKRIWKGVIAQLEEATANVNYREGSGQYIASTAPELALGLLLGVSEDEVEAEKRLAVLGTPIRSATYYSDNPFALAELNGVIGVEMKSGEINHVVEGDDFLYLTQHILRGGIFGWLGNETYPEVKDAISRLAVAVTD